MRQGDVAGATRRAERHFPTMFRNEDEFKACDARVLREPEYTVQPEVPVRRGHRLDLLAVKDNVRTGIEAKFERRGLLDDVTKSQCLLRLPDADEMYVCGPKMFMSEDVRASPNNSASGSWQFRTTVIATFALASAGAC